MAKEHKNLIKKVTTKAFNYRPNMEGFRVKGGRTARKESTASRERSGKASAKKSQEK